MDTLFDLLWRRVDGNARNAVERYRAEVPEYRVATGERELEAAVLDFAVFLRRLVLTRAGEDRPLTGADLERIGVIGQARGEHDLSLSSQRVVLGVHTTLMVHEIHDVATPRHTEELLRLTGWLGAEGMRARSAYLAGFLSGVGRSNSMRARVATLTRMALSEDPAGPGLLGGLLGVDLGRGCLVTVVCVPADAMLPGEERERVAEELLARWRYPLDWTEPGELVALVPFEPGETEETPAVRDRALGLARDVVAAVGRPCSLGAAAGLPGGLADGLETARRLSGVAPPEAPPRAVYTVEDLFVELAVAGTPAVDAWLRTFADRLATGPDLFRTLDAYYRHDMGRVAAATELRVHPRTLDYRLQRVRALTGIDPASTQGVRIFTSAVSRAAAGDRS